MYIYTAQQTTIHFNCLKNNKIFPNLTYDFDFILGNKLKIFQKKINFNDISELRLLPEVLGSLN